MIAKPRVLGAVIGVVVALGLAAGASAGPLDHPGASKSLTCTACHGAGGNSASTSMPIIAGLDPAYFKKQMESYATGKRPSPEMEPYAKQVRELGVDDIAAYFAGQTRQPSPIKSDPAAIARGRAASQPCTACHGDTGRGNPAAGIPSLAGQAPGYMAEQMALFKQDRRNPGDASLATLKAVMRTIPDPTFADLAAYYSSLR
jgi:cytochrome c553